MWRDRASTILVAFLICGLLGWFWLRGERFIAANGPTFDEGVHLTAGYSYWVTGDFRLNAEDPPLLKLLWALPLVLGDAPKYPVEHAASTTNHWQIADVWMYGSGASPRSLLDPARRVNLAVGSCLVLLVGWCAYRIWGSKLAGLAASAFAATDPTFLALSCVLSTDVGLAFFAMLSCYLMWEYVGAPSRGLLIATGISLGLMLAAKFSAVGIVVGLGVAGLVYLLLGGILTLPAKEQQRGFGPALELAIRLGVIAVVTVAATYAIISFDQWGKGLKFQLTRGGHGDGVMYLNGELSRRGWFHYFIVTLLLKLPLGLLIAAGVSAAMSISRLSIPTLIQARIASEGQTSHTSPALRACIRNRNLWLVVPPLLFFALASYSRVDMGIRVILPVLPFFYLLAGGLASTQRYRPLWLIVLAGCLVWNGLVAERTNPREIAYFNELAGTPSRGTSTLADSNLDWGQGLPALKAWLDSTGVDRIYLAYFGTDRPEAYGILYQQLPGYGRVGTTCSETIPANAQRHIVAVSANHLFGLFLNDPNLYAWLRDRVPVTVLDGSIHVFDLTGDPEAIARVRALSAQ
jgi:hypothetical protein